MTNILLNAARDYIAFGLRVIALSGKAPNVKMHPRGLYDAFTSATPEPRVAEAFDHDATTGVGIVCGYPVVVVDIDGPEGAEEWARINGGLEHPQTWVAKTGRGLHLYYADTQPRRPTKLGEKLDFKAEGGYVAAPPSLHPDGHRYEWLAPPTGPIEELPDALASRLAQMEYERNAIITRREQYVRHAPLEDGVWYATRGLGGPIETVRTSGIGNRNHALYWAARTLAEEHADDSDWESLLEAAGEAGLTRKEALQTMRSARKAAGDV